MLFWGDFLVDLEDIPTTVSCSKERTRPEVEHPTALFVDVFSLMLALSLFFLQTLW